MKHIIGFVLLYIIASVSSSIIYKFMISEETWLKCLKKSAIIWFFVAIGISSILGIIYYCF